MTLDFSVQRFTKRCAASGQALQAGEVFYAALVKREKETLRFDYSESHWAGPPDGCIGWWKGQVPTANQKKATWAPTDVMFDLLDEWEGQPENETQSYLLALLLVRKRQLQWVETEVDENGVEWLLAKSAKRKREFRLPATMPEPSQVNSLQSELLELLMTGPWDDTEN